MAKKRVRVIPLGGAGEVGRNMWVLECGDEIVLLDCGVMFPEAEMLGVDLVLPDITYLREQKDKIKAVLLTHGHEDHIGALPLVAARYPATPIYASPASIRLMEVMLGDAVRVMARRAADELELPLYDQALVAAALRQLRPLQPGAQALAELPEVAVYAQRAGHIAGAVSLGFEAADGRLVISGDVSATPQRTILGAAVPAINSPPMTIG